MTNQEKKALYLALSAPFSEEAIERTEGRTTGRGYDTTGIKYQYVVNRLNEVLGMGSWRTEHATSLRETSSAQGRTRYEATCDITLRFGEWTQGQFLPWAEAHATGGHTSSNEADARKGAFTNGLKKAAAMLGCGKQAYEGTLDDDNLPPESTEAPTPIRPVAAVPPPRPPPPVDPPVEAEPPADLQRNRLTSKQLGAISALSRKLGYQPIQFRQFVKGRYGVQPEFLDRRAASDLIGHLSARASNGHAHPLSEAMGAA
jgi:hypothetical protein